MLFMNRNSSFQSSQIYQSYLLWLIICILFLKTFPLFSSKSFTVLPLTRRSWKPKNWVFHMLDHPHGYSVAPAPLAAKPFLFPVICHASYFLEQVVIKAWICFYALYSVQFIGQSLDKYHPVLFIGTLYYILLPGASLGPLHFRTSLSGSVMSIGKFGF